MIEKHLHEHFANLTDNEETAVVAEDRGLSTLVDSVPETVDQPFAKVNSVVENSPAETAGLKPGDLIRNFGYVDHANHDNLRKVAECVQGNEGVRILCASRPKAKLTWPQQNILVKALRINGGQTQELRLMLVPRRDWGGRGLLGCLILPL